MSKHHITEITKYKVCACGKHIVPITTWVRVTMEARKGFYPAATSTECRKCYHRRQYAERKKARQEAQRRRDKTPVETIPDTELHPDALKVRELLRASRRPKSHKFVTRISERWTT